ncbi:hypothetical protein ACFLWC_01450 [Chloroflexota bacterium]
MIKKLTCLLGNIVGRIKRKMRSTFILVMATICVPTGFYLAIEIHQVGLGVFLVLWGAVSILVALFMFQRELREAQRKAKEAQQKSDNLSKQLIEEIKGLRQDLTNKGREDG